MILGKQFWISENFKTFMSEKFRCFSLILFCRSIVHTITDSLTMLLEGILLKGIPPDQDLKPKLNEVYLSSKFREHLHNYTRIRSPAAAEKFIEEVFQDSKISKSELCCRENLCKDCELCSDLYILFIYKQKSLKDKRRSVYYKGLVFPLSVLLFDLLLERNLRPGIY